MPTIHEVIKEMNEKSIDMALVIAATQARVINASYAQDILKVDYNTEQKAFNMVHYVNDIANKINIIITEGQENPDNASKKAQEIFFLNV